MANWENYAWSKYLPSIELNVCVKNKEEFFATMIERQEIWKRRFLMHKPAPWTEDKILRDYKFTNVYRELDRSSQWMLQNITTDENLDLKNVVWKQMVYRYFNSPNAFQYAIDNGIWRNGIPDYAEYNEDQFADVISTVRSNGLNPFTNAYYINNTSLSNPGKGRDWHYSHRVIPTLHDCFDDLYCLIKNADSPKQIFDILCLLPGSGAFIAHEFYQDYTYIPRYTGKKLMRFTQNDFTNVGPGASLGLRLIYPSLRTQESGIYALRDESLKYLTGKFSYLNWDIQNHRYCISNTGEITLHQIEMWLCEYSKYWKMKTGKGRQRSTFKPQSKDLYKW